MININIKKLDSLAIIPKKAHSSDAGFDLYNIENFTLNPNQTKIIPTGIALEIPIGFEGQIRSRSGLAANSNIFVLNSPGTIDANYRGEIKVILHNADKDVVYVGNHSRIAQIVIQKIPNVEFIEVNTLDETDRGDGGLGSTGI